MARKCVSVKLLLKLMVFLMFVFATSSTTQKDGYVIRNVGIKLCEHKCIENGQCLSIEYNPDTLTCRLSTVESTMIKKKEGYVILPRDHSRVLTGACTSSKCSLGQRCLETRSGKTVCVQGDKQNYTEKCPQHKVIKYVSGSLKKSCRRGELDRVGHNLSQGLVDSNSRDAKHGKTPLIVAALKARSGMFVFLINKWANISEVGNGCKNILHWVCKSGLKGRFRCLLQQYNINTKAVEAPSPPLVQPVCRGNRGMCRAIVCMGTNVLDSHQSKHLLHWTIKSGHVGIVKYILTQKLCDTCFDTNVRLLNGKTPLMTAVMHRQRDVFEFLISMGADASLVDLYGNNILHQASLNGSVQIAKYILSQNLVDINAKNTYKQTAAMIAKHERKLNVYNLLVSRAQ